MLDWDLLEGEVPEEEEKPKESPKGESCPVDMEEECADETGIEPWEGSTQLWRRRVPNRAFESIRRQYRLTGRLPATRLGLDKEVLAALADDESPIAYAGFHPRQALSESLGLLDRKLSLLIGLAYPGIVNEEAGEPRETRVRMSGDGLVFWERTAAFLPGDVLEMHVALQPGSPFLARCYARVLACQPDGVEWVAVSCRFELIWGKIDFVSRPLRQAYIPPTSVAKPPPSPRPSSPPAPTPAPPPPPLEPAVGEGVDDDTILVDLDLALGQGGEVMALSQDATLPPRLEVSAGDRADNRRQDVRVNDEIPFSWKIISEGEFSALWDHYRHHRNFVPRDKVIVHKKMLMEMDQRIRKIDELGHSKLARLLAWLRQQTDLGFRRARHPEEENLHHVITMRLSGIVQYAGANLRASAPKTALVLGHAKGKMERMVKRAQMDSRTDPRERQEVESTLRQLQQDVVKFLETLAEQDKELALRLRQFNDAVDKLDYSHVDWPNETDPPLDTVLTYPVNLSATGVAFRTRNPRIEKGDRLEMRLVLSSDGTRREESLCYGTVVVIKGPDPDRRMRVASRVDLMSRAMADLLYQHVARVQREKLSGRIDVRPSR
ncbi:MAG: PilZ domain-containing protein [Magnetococcales bacterium]|nr:PilZ domain-containing protein [Magnetococcales bacterium]